MLHPRAWALVAALFLLGSVAAHAATLTVFTDETAFRNAAVLQANDLVFDTFDNGTMPAGVNVDSDWLSFIISNGALHDRVTRGGDNTVYTFSPAAYGFGGTWDMSPGAAGSGLELTVTFLDGTTQTVGSQIPGTLLGFWGFVSDEAFQSVLVDGGTGPGLAETYDLQAILVANPEPGTLALFGLGLAGMIGIGVRRRRARSAAQHPRA